MRFKMVLAVLGGSVLVHAVVTACSSTVTPSASADPTAAGALEVSVEPCTKTYTVTSPGLNLQSAVYTRDGFAGAGCKEGSTTYFIWKP